MKEDDSLVAPLGVSLVALMASMVAPRVSSQGKEEITTRGDREGIKKRCQNGRRCHDPTVALTVDMMIEVSMVASMASMAWMVASRVSVVASMVSMASLVESRKWLKQRAAEPKRDDERVNGLAHSDELTLTVAMMMASMASMVAWWLRWRRWWPGGVDGVEWWRRMVVTGVFDTEGTDVEVPLCPQ